MRGLFFGAAVLALSVLPGCASMQAPSGSWSDCRSKAFAQASEIIGACTAFINAAQGTGRNISGAYNNRGLAYAKLGDIERALADFAAGLAFNERNGLLLANRAGVYIKMEAYDRARVDLDLALGVSPEDGFIRGQRCRLFSLMQEPALALPDCEAALRLNPGAKTRNDLAWVLYQAGRSERAKPLARNAVASAPVYAAFDTLAHIQLDLGEAAAARDSFQRAGEAASRDEINAMKTALAAHGFDPGPRDGRFDARMRAALDACVEARCRLNDPGGPRSATPSRRL
jgi:tetratricopeptide (TPR) repeat protein